MALLLAAAPGAAAGAGAVGSGAGAPGAVEAAEPGIAAARPASAPAGPRPPRRVASLSLCSDELALLIAAPGQLASVTWLAHRPEETALWPRAAGLGANRGTADSVAALRPDLVLTGGFAPRYAAEIAARLGAATLDLPPPRSLADLRRHVRATGAALGQPARALALLAAMDSALGPQPPRLADAILLQGGGRTPPADGLTAQLLRHAGVRLRAPRNGRAGLETLLADPPELLLVARYRPGEVSLGQLWREHPSLSRLPAQVRRIEIDARAFLCPGPLAAFEVARLRRALAKPPQPPGARPRLPAARHPAAGLRGSSASATLAPTAARP